jgi:hypothetical protein
LSWLTSYSSSSLTMLSKVPLLLLPIDNTSWFVLIYIPSTSLPSLLPSNNKNVPNTYKISSTNNELEHETWKKCLSMQKEFYMKIMLCSTWLKKHLTHSTNT